MLAINSYEVTELLTIQSCIEVMKSALTGLAKGEAFQGLRSVVPIGNGKVLGQMPGFLGNEGIIGTKVITVFKENSMYELPSHQGIVLLFDSNNGKLKAAVNGTAITAIRTAAVSAVATEKLAKRNAEKLSILGTGEQARAHLEAMLLIRPIKLVKIWGRNIEKALLFKKEMENKFNIPIQVCDTAKVAVEDADIICTVTASNEPILKGEWVGEGTHINAVGACQASERELDSELVKNSRFYVDRVESAIKESGDFLLPLKEGIINHSHIIGEIGDLLTHKIEGRTSELSITVFESLGLAIQDLAAANFIYEEALKQKKGINILW